MSAHRWRFVVGMEASAAAHEPAPYAALRSRLAERMGCAEQLIDQMLDAAQLRPGDLEEDGAECLCLHTEQGRAAWHIGRLCDELAVLDDKQVRLGGAGANDFDKYGVHLSQRYDASPRCAVVVKHQNHAAVAGGLNLDQVQAHLRDVADNAAPEKRAVAARLEAELADVAGRYLAFWLGEAMIAGADSPRDRLAQETLCALLDRPRLARDGAQPSGEA